MLKIICEKCEAELSEPGGLIFSPPDENDRTEKTHVCPRCHLLIIRFIKDR